jgi:carboxypeptidase Taq
VWKEARAKSDFTMFAPSLEKMFGLARRKAECYGIPKGGEAYDALLNEYEPGATGKQIEQTFTPLRAELSKLIAEVKACKKKVSTKCLDAKLDAADQHKFGLMVLDAIGFDLKAGRLDTTTHPFCEGLAPGDTRLTTRYRGEKFTDALYGTMHEAGHGIYEQGLPKAALYGQPISEAISLGIHESQSRMWENFVGRSKSFWKWAIPKSKKYFGKALTKHDPKVLFAAVNTVTPSFVRVDVQHACHGPLRD